MCTDEEKFFFAAAFQARGAGGLQTLLMLLLQI